ncbi:hypothetical protein NM208_g13670 [Fusarium decemcellulare]|uniref:Uncharacterized protein n=1 Tax=Fusarium decemcellulare TaxID=57161 RepID=A0ACC1RKX3_9HYPO|nr:hypothetical protein NM208_g13670 [Fusarium decemcellulare]
MSRPPTPVSACPLKRLEFRDGSSTRIYNSRHPSSIFTFTVEGERSIDAETGTLIILIYQGMQQVVCILSDDVGQVLTLQVSIRLNDLAKSSRVPDDIVSVDRRHKQLCISVPSNSQSIIAHFEEKRDFNIAVYLLQKSDLHINDSIPSSLPPTAPSSRSLFDAPNLEPRLASIKPLSSLSPNSMQDVSPSNQSFTTVLNTPLQYSPIPSPVPSAQLSYSQGPCSVPNFSSPNHLPEPVSVPAYLSPYNMHLARGGNTHMPHIGSPLRNSFNPEFTRQPSNSTEPTSFQEDASLPDSQTYPATTFSRGLPLNNTEGHPTIIRTKTSQDEAEVIRSNSRSSDLDHQGISQVEVHDFRDLMPQPRKLPFESRSKRSASLQEPLMRDETTEATSNQAQSKRAKRLANEEGMSSSEAISRVRPGDPKDACRITPGGARCDAYRGTSSTLADHYSNTPIVQMPQIPTAPEPISLAKKLRREVDEATRDAECQTDMQIDPTTSNASNNGPNNPTLEQTSCAASNPKPMVLVTHPSTLREVHQATSKLFEQYEADLANGSDEKISAKFYLYRIRAERRGFWLSKLGGRLALFDSCLGRGTSTIHASEGKSEESVKET